MAFAPISPSTRLAAMAGTLIIGETAGFALPTFAVLWPGFVCCAGLILLAAYAWRVRHVLFPVVFVVGVLLALRTDSARQAILRTNAGLNGPRPPWNLPVESEPEPCRRKDGTEALSFESHLGPLPLRVVASTGGTPPVPGEVWSCRGWIAHRPKHGNRFSRRTLWVTTTNQPIRVSSATATTPVAAYATFARELARRADAGLAWCPELSRLNRAILLGTRTGLSRKKRAIFADAGTIHVFAISGLHVMVIALLIDTALARLDASPRLRGLISVPLVAAYTVLTGARPSAVRAALMTSLYLLGPAFGRRPDTLGAWSITALTVYSHRPERIFDLGCTLSFAVMFGIVVWVDWSRRFASPFEPDACEDIIVPPWWWRWGREKLRELAAGFGVSFAAWVAGVPIAAAAFGRFTPGGLIANLVVISCADRMVKLGASGLVLSFLCLPLAAICNNLAAGCTWMMTFVSEKIAALPFSNYDVKPWNVLQCMVWYALWLLAFFLVGHILPRRVRVARTWWRTKK